MRKTDEIDEINEIDKKGEIDEKTINPPTPLWR